MFVLKKISDREWAVVAVVVFLLISQVVYSYIKVFQAGLLNKNFYIPAAKKCKVEITGAVKKPGVYDVHPGFKLQKILKKAGLEKCADTRGFLEDAVIVDDVAIHVPKLENLVIYIQDKDFVVETVVLPLGSKTQFVRGFLKKKYNITVSSKVKIKPFMVVQFSGSLSKKEYLSENDKR